MLSMNRGVIFILSAPSGAGKTTLCKALKRHFPHLAYSVSYTTRQPRPGEQAGRDYFFVSREEFETGIQQCRWAEWARVHGHYYGTSALWIAETIDAGMDILMDIDVQGARQIANRFPQAITIFILPPSMEVLGQRLRQRSTDSDAEVKLRLANAQAEMDQKTSFQYQIINDDLNAAVIQLVDIIEKQSSSAKNSSGIRP
jgi:guanylate kinase